MEKRKEPYQKLILVLSIVIPITVAVAFKIQIKGYDLSFLPPIYALINGITAGMLVVSYWAIKNKKRFLHETLNRTSIGFSAAFLVMYMLYHMTSEPTPYGGQGPWRSVYFFILISHISLSVVVIPLVLLTFSRALAGNFDRHRRLAKFTYPIWLYVAVTGVIVYLMISPYYAA